MPVDMSPEVLATYDFRHQPINNLLVRAVRPRNVYRRQLRTLKKQNGHVGPPSVAIADTMERTAEDFRTKGYGFVDPFFDQASHRAVVDGWPSRAFFNPMANILKSYDFGFKWLRGGGEPENIERFPAIKAAYDALRSPEFERRVSDYWGDGIDRKAYSITLSWATAGSSLIPHKDGVADNPDPWAHTFVNYVIFVAGTGGERAGGTCIMGDNEYNDVFIEPTQLTNSAIAYKSTEDFYHGFKPMKPRSYRWTINAQYAAEKND
jgi:hypothetical protein